MKYTITVFFLLFGVYLYGCSCSEPTVDLPIKEMNLSLDSTKLREIDNSIIFEGILVLELFDSLSRYNQRGQVYEVTDVYNQECVDSITVWTALNSGSCGFESTLGEYSIIVASEKEDGTYYNARADCWRGVSENIEPSRFQDYRNFLISIKYKIDGFYSFSQRRRYWDRNNSESVKVPQVIYSIINGQLNGDWWLYDKRGFLIEKGRYVNNRMTGVWKYLVGNKREKSISLEYQEMVF